MQDLNNLVLVLVSEASKRGILGLSEVDRRKLFMQSWELVRGAELFLREQGKLGAAVAENRERDFLAPRKLVSETDDSYVDAWWIGFEQGGKRILQRYNGRWRLGEAVSKVDCMTWLVDSDLGVLRVEAQKRWGASMGWPTPDPEVERARGLGLWGDQDEPLFPRHGTWHCPPTDGDKLLGIIDHRVPCSTVTVVDDDRAYYTAFALDGVPPHELHVTHKYLGRLGEARQAEVTKLLFSHFAEFPFKGLRATFDTVEFFGPDKDIRVLIPSDFSMEVNLNWLRNRLHEFRQDDYPDWNPHVTVSEPTWVVKGPWPRYVLMRGKEVAAEWFDKTMRGPSPARVEVTDPVGLRRLQDNVQPLWELQRELDQARENAAQLLRERDAALKDFQEKAAELNAVRKERDESRVVAAQKAAELVVKETHVSFAEYSKLVAELEGERRDRARIVADHQKTLQGLVTPGTVLDITHGTATVVYPGQAPGVWQFNGSSSMRVEIAAGRVLKWRLDAPAPALEKKDPVGEVLETLAKLQALPLVGLREQAAQIAERNAAELFKTIEAQLRPFNQAQDDVKSKCRAMADRVAKEVVDLCLAAE